MQHTLLDATCKSKQSHDRTLQAIPQRHKLDGIAELADRHDPIWFGTARIDTLLVKMRRSRPMPSKARSPSRSAAVDFDAPFQEQPI